MNETINPIFLPDKMEFWEVKDKNGLVIAEIMGDMIAKDKRIPEISAGYTHYFRTEEGLKVYSAFSYTVEKKEIIGMETPQAPEKPTLPYEFGKTYYSVGALSKTHDGIEEWRFTNDRYDQMRLELGIVFETRQEAEKFKEFLKGLKNERVS